MISTAVFVTLLSVTLSSPPTAGQLGSSALSVSALSTGVSSNGDQDDIYNLPMGKRAANMGAIFFERLNRRKERAHERRRSRNEVCYDIVGCFPRGKNSQPLKKTPQSPDELDTKFLLFTRDNAVEPEELTYGDKRQSIVNSSFIASRPTKIIAHGYKGSIKHQAAIDYIVAFLKAEDCNVVLVDWEKGAAGPSYPLAVANTQLIGRQLALLLIDITSLGADPDHVHVIGFSLGAHVAGFAGRAVQTRGIMVGRITGMDPASPLFRQSLSASLPPLNSGDAKFVDVIHTNAAKVWVNGFGLYNPIGHVDFFPNGGENQPGCSFVRASLIVSHLEGHVNTSAVCNHGRAHRLFLESILSTECRFSSFSCPGGRGAFEGAECFPQKCDGNSTGPRCGEMGYSANKVSARGPLFLVTRDSPPFCGEQLHATVIVSQRTTMTRGYFQLSVQHGNDTTAFELYCEAKDVVKGGLELRSMAAARFNTISPSLTPQLRALLSYRSHENQNPDTFKSSVQPRVYIDSITIADLHGNRWHYCGQDTLLKSKDSSSFDSVEAPMALNKCVL